MNPGLARSTQQHRTPLRSDEPGLVSWVVELASEYGWHIFATQRLRVITFLSRFGVCPILWQLRDLSDLVEIKREKWHAWADSNRRPLVPETISIKKANLLNGRQKALQPSQVQPVQ